MNKLVLLVTAAALLVQGYLDNKTEKELRQQILQLKKDRWEFYAECEEAFKKCESCK